MQMFDAVRIRCAAVNNQHDAAIDCADPEGMLVLTTIGEDPDSHGIILYT